MERKIEKPKKAPLNRVLDLPYPGIASAGECTAQSLAEPSGFMDALMVLTVEELEAVDALGPPRGGQAIEDPSRSKRIAIWSKNCARQAYASLQRRSESHRGWKA